MTAFETSLNEPQRETLARLRKALRGAHYTNVCVRKDGQDMWFEADWLRNALDSLCTPDTHK